jgi:toxin ParE1/3/4
MPSFSLTHKAVADLLSIGRYTEKQWGPAQRRTYLSMIDETFSALAQKPLQGQDCSNIKTGYRKKNIGSHVIFYRQINDEEIQIVRILHGRMDFLSRL